MEHGRLWGGRFAEQPEMATLAFMSGRDVLPTPPYDYALVPFDIWVNRAHSLMLGECGIIPKDSRARILAALDEVEKQHLAGKFSLDPSKEDVHSNIEGAVTALIGEEHAGHMHTGRSRNDQVLTDMRMLMRTQAVALSRGAARLAEALFRRADETAEVAMPGFTHHQHATPTTFGHVLAGWGEATLRDAARFEGFGDAWALCPLGAAASYGTTLPIDRELTARLLGFDGPEPSSVDCISTRWEAEADLVHAMAATMTHLSQIAQALILLSTTEFGAVRIADAYCAGSSIMPQKRNAQTLEAVKAHATIIQDSVSTLMALGGSNLFGYNSDQMWTKYLTIDSAEATRASLVVVRGLVETLTVNVERLAALCEEGFLGATALVEALVRDAGIPFRIAKQVVEIAVAEAEADGSQSVTTKALISGLRARGIPREFDVEAAIACQRAEAAVARADHTGGPAPGRVREACGRALSRCAAVLTRLEERTSRLHTAEAECRKLCQRAQAV